MRLRALPPAALALLAGAAPAAAAAQAPKPGPDLPPPPAAGARAAQAPPPAPAGSPDASLRAALAGQMRRAGRFSGAYVRNLTDRRTILRWRAGTPRSLASNTKLFTTAALLRRLGADGRLETAVLGQGRLEASGTWQGDLVLRGGGDPTFGDAAFTAARYAGGATVEELADQVANAGVLSVSGSVVGDESRWDSHRGGPASGYATSRYVGPLSALSFNRGLAGSAFVADPPRTAAARLDAALEANGVAVRGRPRTGAAAAGGVELAAVRSPTAARLAEITNKRSDNFFAEMLLKELGARASGHGTTAAGAADAMAFARSLRGRATLTDGSGLARANRAAPARVAWFLERMRARPEFPAFEASLAVAGRDGTLSTRMRSGPARGRCRAKTGTLAGVSALSGYCTAAGGDTLAFSILMNGVSTTGARRLQDRMAQAMAAYRG